MYMSDVLKIRLIPAARMIILRTCTYMAYVSSVRVRSTKKVKHSCIPFIHSRRMFHYLFITVLLHNIKSNGNHNILKIVVVDSGYRINNWRQFIQRKTK